MSLQVVLVILLERSQVILREGQLLFEFVDLSGDEGGGVVVSLDVLLEAVFESLLFLQEGGFWRDRRAIGGGNSFGEFFFVLEVWLVLQEVEEEMSEGRGKEVECVCLTERPSSISISRVSILTSALDSGRMPGTSGITRVGWRAANLEESVETSEAKMRS